MTVKVQSPKHHAEAEQRDAYEIRRLTLDEYHRLIDIGFFPQTERIELIEGVLHRMTPRGPRHAECLERLLRIFFVNLDQQVKVRAQDPITMPADGSEPEPDVVLAASREGGYADRHPTPNEVHLVVEIADTSLDADRRVKTRLYAGAGIADYWIVNLVDDQIEVYREPATLGDDGPTYRQRTLYGAGDMLTPLHFSNCEIDAGDVLPPRQTDTS